MKFTALVLVVSAFILLPPAASACSAEKKPSADGGSIGTPQSSVTSLRRGRSVADSAPLAQQAQITPNSLPGDNRTGSEAGNTQPPSTAFWK